MTLSQQASSRKNQILTYKEELSLVFGTFLEHLNGDERRQVEGFRDAEPSEKLAEEQIHILQKLLQKLDKRKASQLPKCHNKTA